MSERLSIDSIFCTAIEIESPEKRQAYLDSICAGDAELRQQIERLLQAHYRGGSILETKRNLLPPTIDQVPTECPGTVIGPYKILHEIGHGGMGVVFMAEQHQPVKRRVALKIIKPGMDSRQVIARFEAERQALSLMDHPNIAKVLDAGTTSTGRPYFVMELVKGQPITQYCDEHHMTPRQRLELLLPVCQAIQHAHQKGIIHRDIKPSNILVAEYDNKPVPKVIDFGVAKAIHQPLTDKTMFTGLGNIVGTLEYMSPEQAKVNQLDIDTRSDIYSLGVLMYELLTGSTPFDRKRLKQAAWDEMLRIIREEEPQRPSTRISTTDELPSIAVNRGTEPKKLSSQVHGELDWIVMKALDKDRNRRYETANGFAMDLQRYLANEAVTACPPSAGYRFRKFVSRNKAKVLAASIVLAALLLGILGATWGMMQARAERDEKELARQDAESNFQRTLKVVDDFYTLVSQNTIFDVPGLQPVRKDLLEKARDFYQETANKRPDDPHILAIHAATYFRLTMVYFEVDRMDDLVLTMKQGVELAEQLYERFPLATEAHLKLAGAWHGMRRMQAASPLPKDHVLASRNIQKFIAVWKKFLSAHPDHPLYQRDIAIAQLLLGALHNSLAWRTKKVEEANLAKAWLEPCIPTLEKLVRANPNDRTNREFLAVALVTYAQALEHLGKSEEGNQYRQQSNRIQAKLASDFPESYRGEVVSAKTNQIKQLRKSGNYAEAEKVCLEAMQLLDTLLHEQPGTTQYGLKKLGLLTSLSQIRKHLNKPVDIDVPVQQLLETCRRRYKTWPDQPTMRTELINALRFAADYARSIQNLDAAEMHLLECKQLYEHKTAIDSPDVVVQRIHFYLWQLREFYEQTGKAQERDAICRKALELAMQLTQQYVHQPSCYHWEALGLSYYMLKKYPEAIHAFTRTLELNNKFHGGWYWRGESHLSLKQYDAAVRDYSKAIEVDPQNVATWRQRGWCYNALGQYEKAAVDYRRAIELSPKDTLFRIELGEVLKNIANAEPSQENKKQQEDYLTATRRDLQAHADKTPANAAAQEQLGTFLLWQLRPFYASAGQIEKLEPLLQEVLAIFERLTKEKEGQLWLYWLRLGEVQTFLKMHEKAVVSYTRSIELNPNNHGIWHCRGDAHSALNQVDKAISDYSKAIEIDPQHPWPWKHRAWNYTILGQWDKAVADYQHALKLDSTIPGFHYEFGLALEKTGKFEEAFSAYRKASELDPKNVDYQRKLKTALENQKHFSAIENLLKEIAKEPKNPSKQRGLGILYDKIGNHSEALTAFQKVIELEPAKALNHNNLGIILLKLKKPQEAIVAFRKAIELDPKHLEAHNNLASTLMSARDHNAAIAAFRKVLELDPKNAFAMNNMAWLFLTRKEIEQRNPQEALTLSRQAVELTKDNWVNLDTHSVAAYRNGHWQESLDSREKMIKLRKPRTEDKFFLAMCYWKLGQKEEAWKYFNEADDEFAKLSKPDSWLTEIKKEAEALITASKQSAVRE